MDELPRDLEAWAAVVARLDELERWKLGMTVVREWVEGRLENTLSDRAPTTRELRRRLAKEIEGFGDLELEWGGPSVDETTARRWCWITAWSLLSQDEDLFLMSDALVVPLLEEAAADCPKRAYVLSIVAHHIRDRAHGALRQGWDVARGSVTSALAWLPAIRAARDPDLAAYVERLAAHEKPRKLDLAEATVRVADFWRCHAPTSVTLDERPARTWRTSIGGNGADEEWIVVDGHTGAMHLESAARGRAGKKRRR